MGRKHKQSEKSFTYTHIHSTVKNKCEGGHRMHTDTNSVFKYDRVCILQLITEHLTRMPSREWVFLQARPYLKHATYALIFICLWPIPAAEWMTSKLLLPKSAVVVPHYGCCQSLLLGYMQYLLLAGLGSELCLQSWGCSWEALCRLPALVRGRAWRSWSRNCLSETHERPNVLFIIHLQTSSDCYSKSSPWFSMSKQGGLQQFAHWGKLKREVAAMISYHPPIVFIAP